MIEKQIENRSGKFNQNIICFSANKSKITKFMTYKPDITLLAFPSNEN